MGNRIIIAEDDESMKICYRGFLNKLRGIEIKEVSDGKDLVEEVKSGNYHLIFTDNQMLDMQGLEAIALIRKFDQKIPIYMFAYSSNREDALKAGATDYFSKSKLGEMLVPLVIEHFGPMVAL